MDHYADEIDRASAIAEEHNEECIAAVRRAAGPDQDRVAVLDENGDAVLDENGQPVLKWETTECVDCGEDIESGRLELGKVRCFSCQSDLERRRRQYAR